MDGSRRLSSLPVTLSPPLLPAPAGFAATHDNLVRALVAARAVSKRRLAPRCLWLAADWRAALTAAVRVVHRVHHRAAHVRAPTQVTRAPGLANAHVLVIQVAHLPDGRHALDVDQALLAGGEADLGVVAGLPQELRRAARAAHQLAAAAGVELDIVDDCTGGNVAQRQGIAHPDLRLRATHHQVANLEAVGGQDIALLAI